MLFLIHPYIKKERTEKDKGLCKWALMTVILEHYLIPLNQSKLAHNFVI